MGLIAFLKSKFGKDKEEKKTENDVVMTLKADPADIDPPETRFTEEYKDFLESQENVVTLTREMPAAEDPENGPAEEAVPEEPVGEVTEQPVPEQTAPELDPFPFGDEPKE